MHEWIYGRGKGLPCEDKANTLAVYNAHNEGVLAYFKDRPDDLLVLDIAKGEGWEPLCKFLGCPVPAAPFPHANNKLKEPKGPPSWRRRLKVRKKRVKFAVQIAFGRAMGWL